MKELKRILILVTLVPLMLLILTIGLFLACGIRIHLRTLRLGSKKGVGPIRRLIARLYFLELLGGKWAARNAEAVRQENLRQAEEQTKRLQNAVAAGHLVNDSRIEMWEFTMLARKRRKKKEPMTRVVRVPAKSISPRD